MHKKLVCLKEELVLTHICNFNAQHPDVFSELKVKFLLDSSPHFYFLMWEQSLAGYISVLLITNKPY